MADRGFGGDSRGLVEVRLLSPEDWRLVRDARLAALRDAPQALLPKRPHESVWTEEHWRESWATGLWAVARIGGSTVGLARLTREKTGPHVESVWTHAGHRRRGIASALVRELVRAARKEGHHDVYVWVIHPNPAALGLYVSLGFEPTYERQLIDGTDRVEERLRLTGAPHED